MQQFLQSLLVFGTSLLHVRAVDSIAEGEGPHSKPSTQWRIVNLEEVAYGWAIGELMMHMDTTCSAESDVTKQPEPEKDSKLAKLTWTTITSGDNNAPALRAFDGVTWTEWRSACYMCRKRASWVGLKFNRPISVQCFKLYQWGDGDYLTGRVMLQRWEEAASDTVPGEWQDVLQGAALVGEAWTQVSFTLCNPINAPESGRVKVTNGRYFPSRATFSCSGARIMVGAKEQDCKPDGTWVEDIPSCYPAIALVILLSSIFALETICFSAYYLVVVRNKSPPLQSTTFLPDDSLGSFTTHEIYGVTEVEDDDGSSKRSKRVLTHVLLCVCCRVADTWNSVGQVGYFVGVWIPQVCCPVLPCIGAYFRSQMRRRFQIKGSISKDLFLWICCIPCVAAQEAKHVDHMCDIAEEEAEVMRRAEERKKEKERKLKEQLEAKKEGRHADAAHGHQSDKGLLHASKVGKGEEHEHEHHKKDDTKKHDQKHPTFLIAKSVMDLIDSV